MKQYVVDKKAEELSVDLLNNILTRKSDIERLHLKKKIIEISQEILKLISDITPDKEARLLQPVIDDVNTKCHQLNTLADELMEPFLLFIVGMGKFGKSTLVNSLIGREVADIDVLPKTWKIDIFEAQGKNESGKVKIRFDNGNVKNYTRDKAIKYIENEEIKREESEIEIQEKLNILGKKLKTVEAKEELKDKLYQNILYRSPINEVHWPCEVDDISLLNKFRIVDTPGLWQEVDGEKTNEDLRDYYHKADGVLWMLDANVLASRESKKMIEELEKHLAMVGGKVDNVIAVLNRIDLVKRGNEENVDRVITKAREIYNDTFIDIVPVSAKEAIDGLKNNDFITYTSSGLPKLRASIDSNFSRRASKIKCNSKLNGLKGYLNDIIQIITTYNKRLLKDNAKRKKLNKFKDNELNKLSRDIKNMIGKILDDYSNMVSSNIELKAEKLFDFDEDSKSEAERFLKNEIFCESTLKSKLKTFEKKYKSKMQSVSKKLIKDSQFKEFKHIDDKTLVKLRDLYYSQDKDFQFSSNEFSNHSSFGNALTIAAGGFLLGPVGIILGLLANGLGLVRWAVTKIKLPGIKRKLTGELQKSVSSVKEKVFKELKNDVKGIEKEVDSVREESFASLHGPSDKVTEIFNVFKKIANMNKGEFEYKTSVVKLIKGEDI